MCGLGWDETNKTHGGGGLIMCVMICGHLHAYVLCVVCVCMKHGCVVKLCVSWICFVCACWIIYVN